MGLIERATVVAMFLAVLGLTASSPTLGQKVRGELGSASATTTTDGKQIPPLPRRFDGVIKERAKHFKPWWPRRVATPSGAPNLLLSMTDDQGYGVSGTFGGVIPTPALNRTARAGLRYTQFHSPDLCSPTRAGLMLITDRSHHSVGFGVIGELSTGYELLRHANSRIRLDLFAAAGMSRDGFVDFGKNAAAIVEGRRW